MNGIHPPTEKTPLWDSCVIVFFVLLAVASMAVCAKCMFDLNYLQERNIMLEDTVNALQIDNQSLRTRLTDLETRIEKLYPPPIDPATIPSFRHSSGPTLLELIEDEVGTISASNVEPSASP
jgi:formate-dependent nitrite reductase membrane component NrfD